MYSKKKFKFFSKKTLVFFILLNLVFNLIGIDFGLPNLWHPDEVAHGVTRMLNTKSLNPGRFIYPSFYYYLLFIINLPYAFFLLITGKSSLILTDSVFKTSVITTVHLTSRIFTAILGSLSILMIYLVAKKAFNKKTAIISVAFAATNMALVTYSHFATTDLPVTFFSLIALYFILETYDKPTTKNYLLSGIAIGVATGTKYYAILLALILLFAHLLFHKKIVIDKKIIMAGTIACLTFFLTSPFIILDFSGFYRDMSTLSVTSKLVSNVQDPFPALSYIFHLDNGLGTPLLLFSFLGLIYMFKLLRKNKKVLLLLSWVVIFYGVVSTTIHFSFLRYILPIVPIIIIFGGAYGEYLYKKSKKLSVFLIILILIFNFVYVLKSDFLFINDSRHDAKLWIEENIPTGTKIMVFVANSRYVPNVANFNISRIILTDKKDYEDIVVEIENISPSYIVTSSLYYERYLRYTNMYPRRSPLQKIFGYKTHEPDITKFYNNLFDEKLNYVLVKKYPEEKAAVPDPELINPTILIFKRK